MKFAKKNFDKLLGLTVTLVFLFAMGSGLVRSLDWAAYGLGQRVAPPRTPNQDIMVIGIDDTSLAALGSWPWTRDQLALLVRQLRDAGAATIGVNINLDAPQNELSLTGMRQFRQKYRQQLNSTAKTLLDSVIQQLNTDQTLARVFSTSSNVLLAVPYTPSKTKPAIPVTLSKTLMAHAISEVQGEPPALYQQLYEPLHPDHSIYVQQTITPIEVIARSAQSLGLGVGTPPVDGSHYARPTVVPIGQQYVPSFALLMASHKPEQQAAIQIIHGAGIRVGALSIETDTKFRAHPFYYKTNKQQAAFPIYSFSEVLNGDIPADTFSNKRVLIGLTSEQLTDHLETPIGEKMPPILIEAHTISSLINGDLYAVPEWTYWGRYIAFLLIGIYLMYFLPRLNITAGLATTSLILVIILNVHFVVMAFQSVWLPLMGPAAALITGHVLMGAKRIIFNRIEQYKQELAKSNRLLGQAYQFQGQLDMAFEKYRSCEIDEELLSLTYNLGLDYERKRQFNKAANVFRFIRQNKNSYRDSKERIQKNLQTSNAIVLGSPSNNPESTLVIAKDGIQKPMLGRYRIESELGKGAMGVVYLGSDPKIGRTVAIKTMPLSAEFEEERLEEVKQRFFREAKTAGRLNHYNIVTIYDVGEDQDLAYIAMDFLQGVDMAKFAKKDRLLRVSDVFNVMIQVADALHYAHNQSVVHRDIKPSNIIYDRRTKKPTVTDFGVAHITDNTKTKTGTILGTPSFMSPEQLAGQTVDGRSDLFSLGVTFFQLLTGELPFVAESISSLMFKIANEDPRDILAIRSALPVCVKAVINKLLQKDPEKRYQTGAEFIVALKRCQQNIIAQQTKTSGATSRKTPSF